MSRNMGSINNTEIKGGKFSRTTRSELEMNGFKTYPLTGQSIRQLREAGGQFLGAMHIDYFRRFEELVSRTAEVAVNPSQPFISESGNLSLPEQRVLLRSYSEELRLGRGIEGIDVIIGQAGDYSELMMHLQGTFGENPSREWDYSFTRTETVMGDLNNVNIGYFNSVTDLAIYTLSASEMQKRLGVIPLIIP